MNFAKFPRTSLLKFPVDWSNLVRKSLMDNFIFSAAMVNPIVNLHDNFFQIGKVDYIT